LLGEPGKGVLLRPLVRRVRPGALTLVISLLFGIFGLIPAVIHSDCAKAIGAPTGKYWAAFLIPMACATFFWVVVVVASFVAG